MTDPPPSQRFRGKEAAVSGVALVLDHYRVCDWCPTPDGSGRPEQVHVVVTDRPDIDKICTAIRCDTVDVLRLGKADRIMVVDDTGMIDGRPINPVATALYRSGAPASPWSIHGDVVVTLDRWFE